MKQSDDQTLFAWQLDFESTRNDLCGPLATHPSRFRWAGNRMPNVDDDFQSPYSMTNKGLRIELPVVHRGDDPYGLAYLHCGYYDTRTALPVVRLGPPGTNRYARDARFIGPLMTMKTEERIPTVMFMSQEPSIRVEKRRPLQVVLSEDTRGLFDKAYCSAKTHPENEKLAIKQAYTFPLDCRRGAILLVGYENINHVLILFNIELQHVGRHTCKIICSADELDDDPMMERARLHNMVQLFQGTNLPKEHALVRQIDLEPNWSLIHGDSGPLNNRTSFADLSLSRRILAKFAPYDAFDSRDDGTLVLHIDLLDQSEGPQELYELE